MAKKHPTWYRHHCTRCNTERLTTKKCTKSGMCARCFHQRITPIERFWSYVDTEQACACHAWEDRCWVWTGRHDPQTGYGCFSYEQKPITAHRFLYQFEHGPLPSTLYVLHQPPCLLRHCVRHLYAGTPKQNTQDAIAMKRLSSGNTHWTQTTPERIPRGDTHWTRKTTGAFPRGDDHWTRKYPEKLAYADDHWTHKTPELMAHGANHWTRTTPELLPHGDAHWTRRHPEKLRRGEQHPHAKLTTAEVIAMRQMHASGITPATIAHHFSKKLATVYDILSFRHWKHITEIPHDE